VASRKEQKEALRRERLEREREAAEQARRKRMVGYGVGGVLALAAVVAGLLPSREPRDRDDLGDPSASPDLGEASTSPDEETPP